MTWKIVGALMILTVWVGFSAIVWNDPNAICGLFFPVVITGMGLDMIENAS